MSLVPIEESDGGHEDYLVATDAASVMELVQFNTLEFHPWGTHVDDLAHCDRLVFDLDPDDAVAWSEVIAAARQLRGFLRQAGLESFVRTSGGKGLHLVVPLSPPAPWDRARGFAQAVAEAARDAEPLRYVATMSKQKRKGRIFIDWLRNGRGATSIASFSARARAGADWGGNCRPCPTPRPAGALKRLNTNIFALSPGGDAHARHLLRLAFAWLRPGPP